MKIYETLQLVKSEDLNHHGTLFAEIFHSFGVHSAPPMGSVNGVNQ